MPDWVDVDLVQTVALLIVTALAFVTFLGERDARRDAEIERRLERVTDAVTRLAEAVAHVGAASGQQHVYLSARKNLKAALAIAPSELPETEALLRHPAEVIEKNDALTDEALREIDDERARLTAPRMRLPRALHR